MGGLEQATAAVEPAGTRHRGPDQLAAVGADVRNRVTFALLEMISERRRCSPSMLTCTHRHRSCACSLHVWRDRAWWWSPSLVTRRTGSSWRSSRAGLHRQEV